MDIRSWLAGMAAVTLTGALPAAAQTPRSLFAEAPAPATIAPVTMGLDLSPSSRPLAATGSFQPLRPAVTEPADTQPEKPAASAEKADQPQPESHQAPSPRFAAYMDILPPRRPAGLSALVLPPPAAAGTLASAPTAPEARPASENNPFQALFGVQEPLSRPDSSISSASRTRINALVAYHARLNNVPEALVHRVIVRESKYNPRAVGRGGALGLMQIKTATARGVGYAGGAGGLLDAETNLTYGIKYLAGAWRVSGGNYDRAVSHYARGYYYEAKRMGLASAVRGRRGRRSAEPATTASASPQTPSFLSLFTQQASAQ